MTDTSTKRSGRPDPARTPLPGAQRDIPTIIEALRATGGVLTAAAQVLRISRTTLYSYIEASAELRAARDEIDEEMLDIAEGQLKKLVTSGDREAIKYFLRCKGRSRGWRETMALTGEGGGPIDVRDVSRLSTTELEAIVRGDTRAE